MADAQRRRAFCDELVRWRMFSLASGLVSQWLLCKAGLAGWLGPRAGWRRRWLREETETSTVRLSATNGSPPQSLLPYYFPGPCQPPCVTSPSQPFPVLFSWIIFASLSPPLLFPTARRRRLSSSLTPHNRGRPRMQSPLVISLHPDRIYYTAAPRRCAVSPIRNTLRKMAHLDSLLPSPSPSPPLQTDPNPRPLVLPIQMFQTLAGTRRPLLRVTRQNQLQPTPSTVLNVCSSQAHAHPHRTEECAHDVH